MGLREHRTDRAWSGTFGRFRRQVLVCPTTSAAWTMVFSTGGCDCVADTGSVLSHTAIVAPEFALPAVVEAANATSSLVDGEEVTVDGTRGEVTRF